VMRERRRAEGRCGRENKDSLGSDAHLETSWQAIAKITTTAAAQPIGSRGGVSG
jgi:hypothetical protein